MRRIVSAASSNPQGALLQILKAEEPYDDEEKLLRPWDDGEFDTLGAKFAKAIASTVKGEHKRELQHIEELVLRKHKRLIDGLQIYAWICHKF